MLYSKRLFAAAAATALALAGVATAQPQLQPTAELPMRNLQIEVRQSQADSRAGSSFGASGAIVLSPGQSGGQFGLSGDSRQRQSSQNLSQMVLVLNGRETRINLGNTVPVRVVQSFVRNGQVQVLPGTVLVEANSGFAARPVWRGGDTVEIELGTALAGRGGSGASSAATVAAPLGEWFTIAESDSAMDSRGSGTLSQGQQQGASRLKVELRVSVR